MLETQLMKSKMVFSIVIKHIMACPM